MFLGASPAQLPPIHYARKKGYYVITCDNRPDNPGHKFADKTYDVSTVEKETIYQIAKDEKINGVLTFASDVSAPTAAYVSQKLKLPGNSIDAIETLVYKSAFREYMKKNKFQSLIFSSFDINQKIEALEFVKNNKLPLVLKPVDSSGSRGISILSRPDDNAVEKIENAYAGSIVKKIIIEQYISKKGKQVCGDGYMEKGRLKFIYFGDGHYYENGINMAPWGETFPGTQDKTALDIAKKKIEDILSSLEFNTGPFNVDIFIDENNFPFINEIGPRSGGNYLPTAIFLKTGVDMIEGSVESAINPEYELNISGNESKGNYSCYMIHSKNESGILKDIVMTDELKKHIYLNHPYIRINAQVNPFTKGSEAIGNLILKFNSFSEMNEMYKNINNHVKIILA